MPFEKFYPGHSVVGHVVNDDPVHVENYGEGSSHWASLNIGYDKDTVRSHIYHKADATSNRIEGGEANDLIPQTNNLTYSGA